MSFRCFFTARKRLRLRLRLNTTLIKKRFIIPYLSIFVAPLISFWTWLAPKLVAIVRPPVVLIFDLHFTRFAFIKQSVLPSRYYGETLLFFCSIASASYLTTPYPDSFLPIHFCSALCFLKTESLRLLCKEQGVFVQVVGIDLSKLHSGWNLVEIFVNTQGRCRLRK